MDKVTGVLVGPLLMVVVTERLGVSAVEVLLLVQWSEQLMQEGWKNILKNNSEEYKLEIKYASFLQFVVLEMNQSLPLNTFFKYCANRNLLGSIVATCHDHLDELALCTQV